MIRQGINLGAMIVVGVVVYIILKGFSWKNLLG